MKKTCAQLKDTARQNLLGHYSIPIAAILIVELFAMIINIPFSRMINQGTVYLVPSRIVLGYIGLIIVSLITIVLGGGISYIHLTIARKQDVRLSHILFCFKNHPDKYMGYGVLIMLITFLCELPGIICMLVFALQSLQSDTFQVSAALILSIVLLCIGMIVAFIFMLGFSQTVFLLLDNPSERAISAMKLSLAYMRGNKWQLFKLYLSFIGWLLLGLLTIGIGYLWIQPYFSQSLTEFYLNLIKE